MYFDPSNAVKHGLFLDDSDTSEEEEDVDDIEDEATEDQFEEQAYEIDAPIIASPDRRMSQVRHNKVYHHSSQRGSEPHRRKGVNP
jgi:hypothetical protein